MKRIIVALVAALGLALAGTASATNYLIAPKVTYLSGGAASGAACNLQHWTGSSWAQIGTATTNGLGICSLGLHAGGTTYRVDAVKSNCPTITYWSDWTQFVLTRDYSPLLILSHSAPAC